MGLAVSCESELGFGSQASRNGHVHTRSEEHTSELQSQSNLVCRLLLEKKKKRPGRSSEKDSLELQTPPNVLCPLFLQETRLHVPESGPTACRAVRTRPGGRPRRALTRA